MDAINEILKWIGLLTCLYYLGEIMKFLIKRFKLGKYRFFAFEDKEKTSQE